MGLQSTVKGLEQKLESLKKPIYKLTEPANGYKVQAWFGEDAAAHPAGLNTVPLVDAFIDTVFDVSSGYPVHVNGAPTQEIVYDASSNFNDSTAFGGSNGPGNGQDQYVLETYINTIGQGVVDLRDVNANSGEAARIYVSTCCGDLLPTGHITDVPPYNAGVFAQGLEEGIHCVMVLLSDRTAFGGFQVQWAPTGTDTFVGVPIGNMTTEKPTVECEYIAVCDEVPEGWTDEAIKLCIPSPTIAGGSMAADVVALELSDVLPVADQNFLPTVTASTHRRGEVGELDTASPCDHNHPILRIDPVPLTPDVVFTGVGEMTGLIVLDRWSTEEWVSYQWRALVTQDPGIGWGIFRIPNIAGFQRPEIDVVGTYRSSSTAVQIDTDDIANQGNVGAGPRGPYMGQEAHHWSSSQQIYTGYYRRDNALRMYVEFKARYVCS